jgi:predicted aspartyl protease
MDGSPTVIKACINGIHLTQALVDLGCDCYAAIDEELFQKLNLPLIEIGDRRLKGASGAMGNSLISGVTYAMLEIHGYTQLVYFYVVPMLDSPIILGKPWMKHNDITVSPRKERLTHGRGGFTMYTYGNEKETPLIKELREATQVAGSTFGALYTRIRRIQGEKVAESSISAVSLADIDKALQVKKSYTDAELRQVIPKKYHRKLALFSPKKAESLPPHRPGIDHHIEILKDKDGKEPPLP